MARAMMQPKRLPLENIRVVECATAWAIPCATKLMADLGAEVIKVESITRLDDARPAYYADNDPSGDYWEKGTQYLGANSNKHHLTLNLSTPQGVRLFKELVSVSDVVAENYTPRVMKGFGLDYEALRKLRPDLVMVSSTGFGHAGPWRNYSAFGWGLEPMVISHLTGRPDRAPLNSAIPIPDMAGALHGAFAIMAALQHQRRTGQGQWVDISQYEIGVHYIARALMDYTLNGRVQDRMGNRHVTMCPHNAYPCRGDDMWIAIAVAPAGEGVVGAHGDVAVAHA
ncbi:MAG: CoA transferase, partial [Chloroflexi bacterium]|nr:CoA transferase [Chloroflexota bacterium]